MVLSPVVLEPQGTLFPECRAETDSRPALDVDDSFEQLVLLSAIWSDNEVEARAQQFIARTEDLVDRRQSTPADGEPDEWSDEVSPARANLSLAEKALILRAVLPYDLAPEASDAEALDHLGMALYYRKRLQHPDANAQERRELIKRIYTAEEPQWTVDEIVGLHFILLDSCRSLARPSANLEARVGIIRWVFTNAWRDDEAFSFKHCCALWGLEQPGLGRLHERVREEMADMLRGWTHEALRKKEHTLRKRSHKTGQGDFFLT